MKEPRIVSREQKDQFQSEGYCIIENVIDTDILTVLREECAYFLGYIDAVMDERATETIGISHKGNRYFISNVVPLTLPIRCGVFIWLSIPLKNYLLIVGLKDG